MSKLKAGETKEQPIWVDLQGTQHYLATMDSRHIGHILHYLVEGVLKPNSRNDVEASKKAFTKELYNRHNNAPYWTSLTEPLKHAQNQTRGVPVEHVSERPDAEVDEQCEAESISGSEDRQVSENYLPPLRRG